MVIKKKLLNAACTYNANVKNIMKQIFSTKRIRKPQSFMHSPERFGMQTFYCERSRYVWNNFPSNWGKENIIKKINNQWSFFWIKSCKQ